MMPTRLRQPHCPRLSTPTGMPMQGLSVRNISRRSGFTLIEILIALTMTLIVLFAMAQAFQYASGEIASGRAVLEMSNRLRNAQQLMRTDLASCTVEVRPHTETPPNGFFEYVDGPSTDKTALEIDPKDGYLGDIDDMVAMTCRNLDGSYRGRYFGATLQSSYAEIIWFTEVTDINNDGEDDIDLNDIVDFTESVTLYRRVLLIRPDLGLIKAIEETSNTADTEQAKRDVTQFMVENDISVRWADSDGDGFRDQLIANSLADLSRRENRFARNGAEYPHAIQRLGESKRIINLSTTKMGVVRVNASEIPILDADENLMIGYSGDDILLTDVAGFDIKIYSPNAQIELVDIDGNGVDETALDPSDVGYSAGNSSSGGFVDLATNTVAFSRNEPFFTTIPTLRSKLRTLVDPDDASLGFDNAYCTWSPHYETDGIDQDQDPVFGNGNGANQIVDEGTDGIDNDGINGVDDDGERETAPPYPYPVRGLQVTFRIIEKNSRQVRQTSVIHNLLPQ